MLLYLEAFLYVGDSKSTCFLCNPDSAREKEEALAAALGVQYLLCGWEEAYANSGVPQTTDAQESVGTTEYARRHGATAITVECGQHKEAAAIPVALRAIYGALAYTGLTDDKVQPVENFKRSRMRLVYYKTKNGAFTRPLQHLETVAEGDILARYNDGSVIAAPWPARIIMPKEKAVIGEEWFYLAVDE